MEDEFEAMFKGSLETPYDPARFYTRATNDHNHSKRVGAAVPPEIAGMAQQIVEQKRVPEYQSVGDVIRDALIHRLEWINQNLLQDEKFAGVLTNEEFGGRQNSMKMAMDRRREILDRAEDLFYQYEEHGDMEALADIIDAHEDHAESWPPRWQAMMQAAVDRFRERNGIKRRTKKAVRLAEVRDIHGDEEEGSGESRS